MKRIALNTLAALLILLYTGCTKQATDPVVAVAQTDDALQSDQVITPFGIMKSADVHFVEDGYAISIVDNRVKKVNDKTGKVVADFGPAGPNDKISGTAARMANNLPAALATGWITYAYWYNDTEKPVTYFSTHWNVPAFPATNSGQTIFIFNGMQDGFDFNAHILQPVLQWGYSAAGGSFDWEITNWYVSSNQAFYGKLIKVTPGTSLTGVMQTTAKHGNLYDYVSFFEGYPKASGLRIKNARQLYWANETLESYNVLKNSDYPADTRMKMDSIQFLQAKKNAPLNWTAVNQVGVPQHTQVVTNGSPGGEVDIYFK